MQTRFALPIIVALCLLVLPGMGVAADRMTPVNWESMPYLQSTAFERGEVHCSGGEVPLPGDFPPWCLEGHTIVRHRVLQSQIMNPSDPRIGGIDTVVLNFIVDPSFSGPLWGTIHIDVPPSIEFPTGGSWEGYVVGEFSGLPAPGKEFSTVRIVLLGTGPFLGMRLRAEGSYVGTPMGPKATWVGFIKGNPRKIR